MAHVKVWRLAAMVAIPAAALLIQGRCFPSQSFWERGHSFRQDLGRALRQSESFDEGARRIDSVFRSAARIPVRHNVTLAVAGRRPTQQAALLRDMLAAELDRLPVRDSSVRIVSLVHDTRESVWFLRQAGSSLGSWNPCQFVAYPERGTLADSLNLVVPRLLGHCAFAAMHGQPGEAVLGWISAIGDRSRRPAFARSWYRSMDSTGKHLLSAPDIYGGWGYWSGEDIVFMGCRSGDGSSCRSVLTSQNHAWLRGDLMWWLATTRSEQFGRFWRAGGNYEDAARDAFGKPLSGVLAEFLATRWEVSGTGAALPGTAGVSIATVLLGCLLLSVVTARRRYLA